MQFEFCGFLFRVNINYVAFGAEVGLRLSGFQGLRLFLTALGGFGRFWGSGLRVGARFPWAILVHFRSEV